jgi:hypothetical protein
MIEASIELARLDVLLDAAKAVDRLWPTLRPWMEASGALDESLQRSRLGLQESGTPRERIDRISERLGFIGERAARFDLEFDLDPCASAWDEVSAGIPQLVGPEREALLRQLRELDPGIEAATESLYDARRLGLQEQQHLRLIALQKEWDEAYARFERLREAWLRALRDLEEAEAVQAVAPPPIEPEAETEPQPPPEKPEPEPPQLALAIPPPPEMILPLPPQPPPEPGLVLPPPPKLEAAPRLTLPLPPPPKPLPEPELKLPPEPELKLPPEPELKLPPEPELTLPPEPEPAPEPELTLPPEPEPKPEPELPLPPEPVELPEPERAEPEKPEVVVRAPVPLPPPPVYLKLEKPEREKPEPEPVEVVPPVEPKLPPPPRFVRAVEPEPLPEPPPRPVIVKRRPLPPAPVPVREPAAPVPEPEEPRAVAPVPPPPAAPSVVVEKVDHVGRFPSGPDGIGRGNQTASIWFRATDFDFAVAVQGTTRIPLGCGTRLEAMPSLQRLSGTPGGPRRGKLSILLVSSGGRLAGASPKEAQASAREAAAAGAVQVVARLGQIGQALREPIREVLERAAGAIFAHALPGADRGKLPLERLLALRHRRALTALEKLLSRLLSAEHKAQRALHGGLKPAGEVPEQPAPAVPPIDGDVAEVVVHADREAGLDDLDDLSGADEQEVESAAVDTWIGSGLGVKIFSGVFGAFLPAEGALVEGEGAGEDPAEEPPLPQEEDEEEPAGGAFAAVFEDLERFTDLVGGWAKAGSRLLGKGMHSAEQGLHRLAQVEGAAEKMEGFASAAEGFLEGMGLHRLAEIAGKAGGAAGWVGNETEVARAGLKTADRSMARGKGKLDELERVAHETASALGEAAKGKAGELLELFRPAREEAAAAPAQASPALDEAKRLDLSTLSKMGSFLGHDFAGVRIHTGEGAAEVTRRFNAEAVTVRDHIFFAPGRFNPSTVEGQKLIAHELTHVLQRGRSGLDVRTAEGEALHAEHAYGQSPAMETLNLGRPPPDFRLAAEGEGMAPPAGVHAAKRTRSRRYEAAAKDALPDGEELLEELSGRVYQLLMDELEQAFESR